MAKNTKLALTINLFLFTLMLLLHLARLIFGWRAEIGGLVLPMWASIVALVVLLVVIYLNYKAV